MTDNQPSQQSREVVQQTDHAKQAAEARKYGLIIVDEDKIKEWCNRLEGIFRGEVDRREGFAILDALEREYPCVGEKIDLLRRLLQQKRILDLGKWRDEGYRYIGWTEDRASIWNNCTRERLQEMKRFRVELEPPFDPERSPLTFDASVYVNDRYHGIVRCIVTDEELSKLPISTRSLSKRQTRLRRISDYYRCFETGFPAFIKEQWHKGLDLTKKGRITWKETRG